MADEVKTKLTVEGAEALQELARVQRAEEEHAEAIEKTGKAADQASRESDKASDAAKRSGDEADKAGEKQGFFARQLNNVASSAAGMIAGFFGFQTIISYFEKINEAAKITVERLDAITESANEAAAATLDLHAINMGYSERDEQIVTDFSKATGRSFQESAQAYTNFKSQTATLDSDTQENLFNQALLAYSLTTSGSIEPAAKFIGRASQVTQDPQELTSLMMKSVSLAGESDPAQYLQYAGELLVSGKAAGLTPAETLSQLGAMGDFEVAVGATGLRNVFQKLTADPATRDKLVDMGIDPSQGLYSTYNQLAEQNMTSEQAIGLVGGENARYLTKIIGNIDDVNVRRDQTVQAIDSGDLVGDFNRELADKSPRHAKALQISQMQQELAAVRRLDADRAQDRQIARTRVEIELEKAVQAGTLEPSAMEARLERFDRYTGNPSSGYGAAARLIASGDIPLTQEQEATLGDSYKYLNAPDISLDQLRGIITYQQVLAAAAQEAEAGTLLSSVLPGGDQSDALEISDQVGEDFRVGPRLPAPNNRQRTEPETATDNLQLPPDLQPPIDGATSGNASGGGRVINNFGNIYTGAGDPMWDDLDGRQYV